MSGTEASNPDAISLCKPIDVVLCTTARETINVIPSTFETVLGLCSTQADAIQLRKGGQQLKNLHLKRVQL